MECLTDKTIHDYASKNLNVVENSMVRDHLILCDKCNQKYEQYLKIENTLEDPVYISAPKQIESYVLKRIYSRLPTYSSIFALISISFIFMISWIYIYFDFSNNSLIQALRLTSNDTSEAIISIIKFISNIFSSTYAVFKAVNKFIEITLNINIGVEIISLTFFILTLSFLYFIYLNIFKKVKGLNKLKRNSCL